VAELSNGWRPVFAGHAGCKIALDRAGSCAAADTCTTRVTYGDAWLHPDGHTAQFDDVAGRVFWDGTCRAAGGDSAATLSNGWAPHFGGAASCAMTFRWDGCGGLYTNPVIPTGCADPGVTRDGDTYVLSCTSGNAANAFPLFTSTDLVSWTRVGHILPEAQRPAWAQRDFWAPEIHQVGSHWVAYFSARGADGVLAIGAASAPAALGPYTALAQPLVHDAGMGLIDASEFTAADGTSYLLWKEDGNAKGLPTPIHARALADDGLSLAGATATLISNNLAWEGNLVEGPFVFEHAGRFYLFYSGNAYYDGRYAVGVARASSPLGPYTKAPAPIVMTGGDWVGPGHNSVVEGPGGDAYLVYHAWRAGHVNGPGDQRIVLADQIVWRDGWPTVPGAPSSASRPLP
jgi:beta-xylosidase